VDFAWSAAQEEMFEAALAVARGRAARNGTPPTRFDRATWDAYAEFGLTGLCVPSEYGGLGLDLLTTARVLEAFGQGSPDMGVLFSASAHLFACCVPIAESGSEELKRAYLPDLASGRAIAANAITESEAGSDVLACATSATRDGDVYRLSGSKSYVTNGPVADVLLVYACTQPGGGYFGLSAFLVERDSPGLAIGEPFAKVGLSSSPIASIYLDDCAVPADRMLGGEGQGAMIFQKSMEVERAALVAAYLGSMRRQLDEAIAFAQERRQFGKPISKNQAVSHRIANMKLRLEQARWLVYHACWKLARPGDSSIDASLAKLAVSEAAVQSSLDAIQIHGGLGVMSETGVDRDLRDALPSTIFSGTSELQREIVASRLRL
jgi:alkylation response protein AidB-like acyl-CoA dehydrogenase